MHPIATRFKVSDVLKCSNIVSIALRIISSIIIDTVLFLDPQFTTNLNELVREHNVSLG